MALTGNGLNDGLASHAAADCEHHYSLAAGAEAEAVVVLGILIRCLPCWHLQM